MSKNKLFNETELSQRKQEMKDQDKSKAELLKDIALLRRKFTAFEAADTARKQAEAERDALIKELQAALASVKTLSGLLPICCSCKKVRDDDGYWHQVEVFIRDHSDADFSHSICPDCVKKLYPDLYRAKP